MLSTKKESVRNKIDQESESNRKAKPCKFFLSTMNCEISIKISKTSVYLTWSINGNHFVKYDRYYIYFTKINFTTTFAKNFKECFTLVTKFDNVKFTCF